MGAGIRRGLLAAAGVSALVKSVVIDCTDNYGNTYMGFRSVEFKLATVLHNITQSNSTSYATTELGTGQAKFAFDTTLSKTGTWSNTSWLTNAIKINQRLICVFDTPIEFDEIVINNYHSSGTFTTRGVKNLIITSTPDTYTTTTYGATVTNGTELYNGSILKHVASDTVDDQSITGW